MPLLRFRLFILLLFYFSIIVGQGSYNLLGTVYDDIGNRLPNATVYIEGSTNGTTSNGEGNFQLKVSPGLQKISAQYVGFAKQTVQINVKKDQGLDFRLSPETLLLQEVIVSSKNKNPAYRIVKEAIKKRKYHENEVNAYSCQVYIKGLQRLDKKPASILGISIPVDTGIFYLSESISKVKFERPDKFSEEMIASKFSGKSNGFSYNRASEMMINLYQNSFFIEGLSERSFISPIANNAFISYDYELIGVVYEDSLILNKIKIKPRRSTDPTFSGYMYIIENTWRLHSVDVTLNKANGIEFIDSLRINQIFSPAASGIWMPLTQTFDYKFKAFGFQGSGRFIANYSNYLIEPNYSLIQKKEPAVSISFTDKPKVDLFTKKDFGNNIMTVKESSNEKDDVFWNEVRPVPLSTIEVSDYKIKDSIQVIKESKPYKDSIDIIRNKFRAANLLFSGYTYYNTHEELTITFPTALDLLQFNTVEGYAPVLNFRIRKNQDRIAQWEIKPSIKYGFSNEQLQAKIEGFKTINYKTWEFFYAGAGRFTYQYNSKEPISAINNTYFSLIKGNNYLKLYQNNFAYFGYQKEIAENLRLNTKIEFAARSQLFNTTDFSIDKNPNYTDNLTQYDFGSNQLTKFNIQLLYRPGLKYIDRPKTKFYLDSKFPEFKLNYTKGIPLYGTNNFDQLRLGINYDFRIGLIGESTLEIETGTFLNKNDLTFIDFHHFNGGQIWIKELNQNLSFQLLPYYQYSTTSSYFQGHYEHHFNEFILNKIPLIKRLNMQSVLSVNYLTSHEISNYIEVGFGIEHIFKFMRIDYYSSFIEGNHAASGIRIGAGF